jgi:hypothetical protein
MKAPPCPLAGLLALLALPLAAQHPEVVSSAGDSFQHASGSLTFTVGEVAIETTSTLPHHLTQGFHQPALLVRSPQGGIDAGIPLTAFPNPVHSLLYLRNESRAARLRYTLLDARGLPVSEGPVTELAEISFEQLPAATYLLQVKKNRTLVRHFKIVKP